MPGLILFAMHPEILLQPWADVQPAADKGYVHMLQTLVPVGLRGLFLAALFGAIQSTVNSVLNSTATVFTLDIYRGCSNPNAIGQATGPRRRDLVGRSCWSIAIVLGGFIGRLGGSLFVYIQSLYAFFAPPFAAVFLLGILWHGSTPRAPRWPSFWASLLGIAMKLYVQFGDAWLPGPSGLDRALREPGGHQLGLLHGHLRRRQPSAPRRPGPSKSPTK